MLKIFYGEDNAKSSQEFDAFVVGYLKKSPDLSVVVLDEELDLSEQLSEHATSQNLFGPGVLVKGRRVLASAANREVMIELAATVASSPHLFVLHEGKLDKRYVAKLAKTEAELIEHAYSKAEKDAAALEDKASMRKRFALGDHLGSRDRKLLWTSYQESLLEGAVAEELFWNFARSVKNMIVAATSRDASEAGLHPFVYQKSERYAKNYGEGELQELFAKLIGAYEANNQGRAELAFGLERIIMEV